jgi:hypothetical protein
MKSIAILTVLLYVVSVSVGQAQQRLTPVSAPQANAPAQVAPGAIPYDDFNRKWLDPGKWYAMDPGYPDYFEACYFSTNVLECVREIQDGKLRLAVKSYGATDSNDGGQYGESKLMFAKPFMSMTADVLVKSTSSSSCPASGAASWAEAMYTARFFNTGSGDTNDDVDAHITFAHASTDNAGLLTVTAFLYWQGQYFDNVNVGTVSVGTPFRATLRWIPADHKFVASLENLITHQHFGADVPYSMPDSTPPTSYWNGLYVLAFPANCLGQQTSSQIEATFDNVVTY